MTTHYDTLVSSIYDCALDPAFWPQALETLCDALNAECAFVDFEGVQQFHQKSAPILQNASSRNKQWLNQLQNNVSYIPGSKKLESSDADKAWTLLSHVSEPELHMSKFYQEWMKPKKYRDFLVLRNSHCHARLCSLGVMSGQHRKPITALECRLIERLSPHVRRSLLINEMTANGRVAQALYRQVLDSLSVPVFVVGPNRRLVFTNGSGDALLSDGRHISLANGHLRSCGLNGQTTVFDDVLDKALKGDVSYGATGVGVLLQGRDDSRVAAYVLPARGKKLGESLDEGHCVVFISRRGDQHPMAVDVLRTLFDMTKTEAKVALLIAKGDGPQAICEALDISMNTVRTHLKRAYAKTSTPDQTALGGLVNDMLLPIG